MSLDGEPDRIGAEIYRSRGFVVRPDPWDVSALEVVSRIGGYETVIKLDPFMARELVRELTAWQGRLEVSGLAPVVGPAERG